MYVCMYLCMCVCMYVCICVCMYVCMYASTCVCVCIRVQEDTKLIIIHANHITCTPKTMFCNKSPNSFIAYKTTKKYVLNEVTKQKQEIQGRIIEIHISILDESCHKLIGMYSECN